MNETFYSRWGDPVEDDRDYAHIPGYILRNSAKAGVEPNELAFITQAISFKYDVQDSESRPSLSTLGERLGRTSGTARRLKNSLVKKGLLIVIERSSQGPDGYPDLPSILDFSPLREKCLEIDKEYQAPLHEQGVVDLIGGGGKSDRGGVADLPPKELEVQESRVNESKILACTSDDSGDSILPLTEDAKVEKPKRKQSKKAKLPPKRNKEEQNKCIQVIAIFSLDWKEGEKMTSNKASRANKLLVAIDEAHPEPVLTDRDIGSAYFHFRDSKGRGINFPAGPETIDTMITEWIHADKPRYRKDGLPLEGYNPNDYVPLLNDDEIIPIDYDEPTLCRISRIDRFGPNTWGIFWTERQLREDFGYGENELEEEYIREVLDSQREHIVSDSFQAFLAQLIDDATNGDEHAQAYIDRLNVYLAETRGELIDYSDGQIVLVEGTPFDLPDEYDNPEERL